MLYYPVQNYIAHSNSSQCPLKNTTLPTQTLYIVHLYNTYTAHSDPLHCLPKPINSSQCPLKTLPIPNYIIQWKCNIAHSKNTPLPTQKSYIAHSRRHIATSRTILLTRHSKIPQCKLKDTILTTQRLPNETHHIAHSKNIIPGQNT